MTPEQFTYWLQGYLELTEEKGLTSRQVQIINDHLDLVFKKVTPNRAPIDQPPVPINPQPFPTEQPGTALPWYPSNPLGDRIYC